MNVDDLSIMIVQMGNRSNSLKVAAGDFQFDPAADHPANLRRLIEHALANPLAFYSAAYPEASRVRWTAAELGNVLQPADREFLGEVGLPLVAPAHLDETKVHPLFLSFEQPARRITAIDASGRFFDAIQLGFRGEYRSLVVALLPSDQGNSPLRVCSVAPDSPELRGQFNSNLARFGYCLALYDVGRAFMESIGIDWDFFDEPVRIIYWNMAEMLMAGLAELDPALSAGTSDWSELLDTGFMYVSGGRSPFSRDLPWQPISLKD